MWRSQPHAARGVHDAFFEVRILETLGRRPRLEIGTTIRRSLSEHPAGSRNRLLEGV